jgi:hypothetical protein
MSRIGQLKYTMDSGDKCGGQLSSKYDVQIYIAAIFEAEKYGLNCKMD